jgi:plasmid stability protein
MALSALVVASLPRHLAAPNRDRFRCLYIKLTHYRASASFDTCHTTSVCFHYGSVMEAQELKMATLTIKNIPEKLRQRLKESAAQHRRSVNGEAISCLEKALVSDRVDPEDFLLQVRSLRARMPRVFVTERDLRVAKNQGRP